MGCVGETLPVPGGSGGGDRGVFVGRRCVDS